MTVKERHAEFMEKLAGLMEEYNVEIECCTMGEGYASYSQMDVCMGRSSYDFGTIITPYSLTEKSHDVRHDN